MLGVCETKIMKKNLRSHSKKSQYCLIKLKYETLTITHKISVVHLGSLGSNDSTCDDLRENNFPYASESIKLFPARFR